MCAPSPTVEMTCTKMTTKMTSYGEEARRLRVRVPPAGGPVRPPGDDRRVGITYRHRYRPRKLRMARRRPSCKCAAKAPIRWGDLIRWRQSSIRSGERVTGAATWKAT